MNAVWSLPLSHEMESCCVELGDIEVYIMLELPARHLTAYDDGVERCRNCLAALIYVTGGATPMHTTLSCWLDCLNGPPRAE